MPLHHHLSLVAIQLACNLLTYFGVLKAAPGTKRFIWSVPVIVLHFLLPACVQRVYGGYLPTCIVFLQTTFLGTFKVLALCLNRGPLSNKSLKFWQFQLLYSTPLYPRQGGGTAGGQVRSLRELLPYMATTAFKVVLLATMTYILTTYHHIPTYPKYLVWSVFFYLLLSVLLDSATPFSVMLLGLPLQPSFDQPYLASSFRDLWSRRWNLTISCTLRDVLYEPLWEGSWIRLSPEEAAKKQDGAAAGKQANGAEAAVGEGRQEGGKGRQLWRKHGGAMLVFFVSGIMHEVWLRYFCGRFVGKQLAFFMLQMPVIVAQDLLLVAIPYKIRQQRWCRFLQWASTMAGGVGMSRLFWGSFEECGLAEGLYDLRAILMPWLD